MLVQASEEVGEDSIPSSDYTQITILIIHSTSSSTQRKTISQRKRNEEGGRGVMMSQGRRKNLLPTLSNDLLHSGEDSMQLNDLMVLCTQLQKQVLDLEKAKSDQAIEIAEFKRMEDASKQGRSIKDIDADAEDEVFVIVTTSEKIEQISTADIGGVTAAKIDELTLAQTLIEIKASKPKVVITTATTSNTYTTVPS
ncbi:hypothetical protein Tco_0561633 [Tanacetum coccineum]